MSCCAYGAVGTHPPSTGEVAKLGRRPGGARRGVRTARYRCVSHPTLASLRAFGSSFATLPATGEGDRLLDRIPDRSLHDTPFDQRLREIRPVLDLERRCATAILPLQPLELELRRHTQRHAHLRCRAHEPAQL